MSEAIKDGSGSGRLAKVNASQQVEVRSTSQTEEHEISSRDGLAFYANSSDTADTLTGTATGGPLLYIQNNHASKQLVIARIVFSSDTDGVVVKWSINPVITTIGNNNVHSPVAINSGSTESADGLFYSWDEVGDGMTGISNGSTVNAIIVNSGVTQFSVESALILEKGGGILINYVGAAEISVGVRMFYMDKEH